MKKLLLLSVFGAAALLMATAGTARADHCRSYGYGYDYGYQPRVYSYGYDAPYYGSGRYFIGRSLRYRGHRHDFHDHHHHGHHDHGRRGFSLYFGGRNFGFGLHR